ncbi:hypothetical protein DFH06DRAFT_558293 [Mycena polygramma]|nr:hypothetical protein DFH06DRAFT_558293 [Mycena polygramma]
MHEALRLENVSGLSADSRALAAVAINGSLPALRGVIELVSVHHDQNCFLPVFYHHLDPSKIPSDHAMDAEILSDEASSRITLAFLSMDGLFNLPTPPPGSHHDLWLRVWPWVQFFDVHHCRFVDIVNQDVLRARCFSVISSLMEANSETSRQITSAPGIGVLAAQAWGSYFRDPNHTTEAALRRLTTFFLFASSFDCDFDDFIDGAGGEAALAVLVVRMVDYLLASTNTTYGTALNLCAVVVFSGRSKENTWLSALHSKKYLTALVSILVLADGVLTVPTAPKDLYPDLYQHGWNMLLAVLLCSAGYTQIAETLNAGLLPLIFSVASKHLDWTIGGLQALITEMMRPATQYYPVLSVLENCLPRVEKLAVEPAFLSSPLHVDWQEFEKVARDRLDFKRHFDCGHISHRGCDNMECCKIFQKAEFKRCSGCEYQHYCSKECQVSDWRAGHREACQHTRPPDGWRADHLDGPAFFTGHDRAFLRALVAYDYERHKEHIFLARIVRLRQSGESSSTVFNYTEGQVKISEEPVSDGGEVFSRVARSGRRMHVNAVFITKDTGYWQLLTRSGESYVHDALVTLAERTPPGTDVSNLPPKIVQAVRKLIERACPQIPEIV